MEERYDQIKMNIESIPQNKPEEKETSHTDAENKGSAKRIRSVPETLSISGEILEREPELDEDVELISPNEEIFKRVTEQLKRSESNSPGISGWARGSSDDKSQDEDVKLDDTYASTSQTDHQFMVAFGIGDKADQTLNITEKTNQQSSEIETLQSDIRSDYYEYTDRQQRKEIIGMYKYAKKSIRTKTIMASFFALFILLIENIAIFGSELSGILDICKHPYVHFFIDLFFFTLCIACAYEQMYHGIRSLFSKDYIPESVAVVAVISGIVYSVITLIVIPFGQTPRLYNFPVAFIVVCSLVFSYINVIREKYGFSVVSSKDTKFVLTNVPKNEAEPEQETFSNTSCEFAGNVVRVDRAGFVKNYFGNTNSTVDLHKYLGICFAVSILLPAVFAIMSLFRSFGFADAMTVWYIGILALLPIGVLFMYSVPFFIGNRRLLEEEVSIIGEQAINDFAQTDIVSVNDTTAFPPYNVKLQNFNVYNDYKVEKVLYYAASGFSIVGGPLAEVFEVATKDAMTKSKRAKYVCSGRSYLCVKVDSDTIIFADKYGMISQGIDVGAEKEDAGNISVMYMACNSKLCAKMYIKYKIDEEFVRTVKYLSKSGTGVGIRTFDPNINNELIKVQTELRKTDLCVIRLFAEEDIPKTIEKIDSTIVSKGLSKSLLKAIPVCKKIVNIRKAVKAIKFISSALGAVLLGFLVFGQISFIMSGLIVAYYLGWIAVMTAVSLIMLPANK